MSGYQKVSCSFCDKKVLKETRHFNYNLKLGHNFYCSKLCSYKYKKTGRELTCENSLCKKKFYRPLNDILVHNYCSQSCAAVVNNQKFPKWPKRHCVECGIEFKNRDSQYCSYDCGKKQWLEKHKPKYTKEEIVKMVKEFWNKNNRVPAKREMPEIIGCAHHMFGSWNKAVETAGLQPNCSHDHRMYKRTRTKAKDGHICDSVSEALIDNWLTEKNIPHDKNAHYPNSKHLADWSIKNGVFIEYFGLAKDSPRYDKSIKEKLKLCKESNIKLIAIYPKDLYPKVRLESKLSEIDKSATLVV